MITHNGWLTGISDAMSVPCILHVESTLEHADSTLSLHAAVPNWLSSSYFCILILRTCFNHNFSSTARIYMIFVAMNSSFNVVFFYTFFRILSLVVEFL